MKSLHRSRKKREKGQRVFPSSKKSSDYIFIIIPLVLYMSSLIVDYIFHTHYQNIVFIALCIIFASIIVYYLFRLPGKLVWNQIRKYSFVLLILILPILLLFLIHFIFYRDDPIQQGYAFSFFGNYLTFAGASLLGYAIYLRDQKYHDDLIQKTAKLLSESYSQSLRELQSLEIYASHKLKIHVLPNWREYYYDISHLIQYNSADLYNEMQYVYQTIDAINIDIENAYPIEDISEKYKAFLDREHYSTLAYNHIEVEIILANIAFCNYIPQPKPWSVKEADTIADYASQFYYVIENWLFNYLAYRLRVNRVPYSKVERDLISWLLGNKELNAWVTTSYDYRKIASIASKAVLLLNSKSKRLSFIWGELSIRHS